MNPMYVRQTQSRAIRIIDPKAEVDQPSSPPFAKTRPVSSSFPALPPPRKHGKHTHTPLESRPSQLKSHGKLSGAFDR